MNHEASPLHRDAAVLSVERALCCLAVDRASIAMLAGWASKMFGGFLHLQYTTIWSGCTPAHCVCMCGPPGECERRQSGLCAASADPGCGADDVRAGLQLAAQLPGTPLVHLSPHRCPVPSVERRELEQPLLLVLSLSDPLRVCSILLGVFCSACNVQLSTVYYMQYSVNACFAALFQAGLSASSVPPSSCCLADAPPLAGD